MISDNQNEDSIFPLRDEVEDCKGDMRTFVISCYETPIGFTVRAVEEGRNQEGYIFAAYSETSASSALYRVRQKMNRGLATRHITDSSGRYEMLHDELSGRITSDGHGGLLLVVDGIPLDIDDLDSILSTFEGWEFEVRIVSALE